MLCEASCLKSQVPSPRSHVPVSRSLVSCAQVLGSKTPSIRSQVLSAYICMYSCDKHCQAFSNLTKSFYKLPKNSQAFFKPLHASDLSVACSHHPPDIPKPPQTCLIPVRKEAEKVDRREAKE